MLQLYRSQYKGLRCASCACRWPGSSAPIHFVGALVMLWRTEFWLWPVSEGVRGQSASSSLAQRRGRWAVLRIPALPPPRTAKAAGSHCRKSTSCRPHPWRHREFRGVRQRPPQPARLPPRRPPPNLYLEREQDKIPSNVVTVGASAFEY